MFERFRGDRWRKSEEKSKPLTRKQRKAILSRDNHTPQERGYSEEKGWHKKHDPCPYDGKPCDSLDVHHIEPRRVGGKNEPENLITVSSCFHTGRCRSGRIK